MNILLFKHALQSGDSFSKIPARLDLQKLLNLTYKGTVYSNLLSFHFVSHRVLSECLSQKCPVSMFLATRSETTANHTLFHSSGSKCIWNRAATCGITTEGFTAASLAAAGHVVDEGSIDVGATGADPIQQGFEVSHEVLRVWKLFVDDLRITGIAEHHQASRNPYRFSPRAPGHWAYTDPF